jgi:hypothetical protein
MKTLFNYDKENEDVEVLVLLDGTIGELEDAERTICEDLEDQYEGLEFIKKDDILLYDSDDEMSILEVVDRDDAPESYECAVIYDKKRYTLKSLEYELNKRKNK